MAGNGRNPGSRGPRAGKDKPRRGILFVVPAGTISDRLVHALEREFPWVSVELVDNVRSGCATFEHPVSLILLEPSLMKAAEEASSELARLHPQALTAVIHRDDICPGCSLPEMLEAPMIRGVLPMNVRLDIWLAVIRLMLCGGEYFPPDLCRSFIRRGGHTPVFPLINGTATVNRPHAAERIAELTAREIQVLEMVSRGLQNKSIAAMAQLSEHTVKIHLHNIISKLGVHNRTEAVAKFRHLQDRNMMSASSRYWRGG